jgi:hypothetical protein
MLIVLGLLVVYTIAIQLYFRYKMKNTKAEDIVTHVYETKIN